MCTPYGTTSPRLAAASGRNATKRCGITAVDEDGALSSSPELHTDRQAECANYAPPDELDLETIGSSIARVCVSSLVGG